PRAPLGRRGAARVRVQRRHAHVGARSRPARRDERGCGEPRRRGRSRRPRPGRPRRRPGPGPPRVRPAPLRPRPHRRPRPRGRLSWGPRLWALDAPADGDPVADLLCGLSLPCGLPKTGSALTTNGCEVVYTYPDGAAMLDATFGCRVADDSGCSNGVYTPPAA